MTENIENIGFLQSDKENLQKANRNILNSEQFKP